MNRNCKNRRTTRKIIHSSNILYRKAAHKTRKRRVYLSLQKTKSKYNAKLYENARINPAEYVFYSIFNTSINLDHGTVASMIARSFLALHNKLESNQAKNVYINTWTKSGEKIIVLEGYNHRHLKYLKEESHFAAIDTHVLCQQREHRRVIIVLTVFGQEENLEDLFEGLDTLQ